MTRVAAAGAPRAKPVTADMPSYRSSAVLGPLAPPAVSAAAIAFDRIVFICIELEWVVDPALGGAREVAHPASIGRDPLTTRKVK